MTETVGQAGVFEEERKIIKGRREQYCAQGSKDWVANELVGLSLSGGGIRSATFGLGVLQALAKHKVMPRVDYLSTVSGGGYIGTSLTWLLSAYGKSPKSDDASGPIGFNTLRDTFPFGTRNLETDGAASIDPTRESLGTPHDVIRWLRQHGKYLTPGDGLDGAGFVAVLLRGIFLSVVVYFPLVVLALTLLLALGLLGGGSSDGGGGGTGAIVFAPSALLFLAGGLTGLLVVVAIVYSLVSRFTRKSSRRLESERTIIAKRSLIATGLALVVALMLAADSIPHNSVGNLFTALALGPGLTLVVLLWLDNIDPALNRIISALPAVDWYRVRRGSEKLAGRTVKLILLFAVIGSIPLVATVLDAHMEGKAEGDTGLIGLISMAIGGLSSIGVFRGGKPGLSLGKVKVPSSVMAVFASVLLVYGLLLVGFSVARWALAYEYTTAVVLMLLAFVVIVGLVTNTNYVSLHRYYRDRLMETFMPDLPVEEEIQSRGALGADKWMVHQCNHGIGPYHLINTNVVLVNSDNPRYRSRGGDSFIFSPAFIGSRATGWQPTKSYMEGNMSLASAMAISGAAAHPNTGVGGEGVLRNYFVSFLMAFLSIRLGFWGPNPRHTEEMTWWERLYAKVPNFLYPGVLELLSLKIHERRRHLLLTDGGHFENLGIYELVRRRCKVIIASDAGGDPEFAFTDLANAIQKVRADFGAKIELTLEQLQPMVPRARVDLSDGVSMYDLREHYADKGYIIAKISYRHAPGQINSGWLIFIKSTFTNRVSGDIYGYKRSHPDFPDQSTGDQFFDEKQFEAYREIGFQLANEMCTDPAANMRRTGNEVDSERALQVAARRGSPFADEELVKILGLQYVS